MSRERLYLYDTSLRDGAQTTGVDFSLDDKRRIAALLDALGVDYIEGGYPGANPLDTEFFAKKPKFAHARFSAFGMIRRTGRSASNDPGVAALLDAEADAICYVAKAGTIMSVSRSARRLERPNLAGVAQSVELAVQHGRETMLDCEHFFDGYKANPAYALDVARTAYRAGARWIVLCDTNGGTLPHEVERIVGEVAKHIPHDRLGIHAHNDTENAVANSLAAVRAGGASDSGHVERPRRALRQRQSGLDHPTLLLKKDYAEAYDIGVSHQQLAALTKVSHTLDELLNRAPDRHRPYVAPRPSRPRQAIHASAVMKDPRPTSISCRRQSATGGACLFPDRPGNPTSWPNSNGLASRSTRTIPRLARLLEDVKGERGAVLRL